MIRRISLSRGLKEIGVHYLGNVSHSMKTRLSAENGTLTYCIYLAPADMSGYNVCPMSIHCRKFCLQGSGYNKLATMSHGVKLSKINISRIKKTKAFFENRQVFMDVLIQEIEKYRRKAVAQGMNFAVRLNGTSDLSPMMFRDDRTDMNILELFPDVQFYDYTKVPARINLLSRYPNYDLTFSYDGHNWDVAEKFLKIGGKVAVVFRNPKELPVSFRGFPVCDGNAYDMRFLDPKSHVVGLHFHVTANNYKLVDGKRVFVEPNSDFVVPNNSQYAVWA